MKLSTVTKVRAGFSIAILMALMIVEMVVTTGIDIRHHRGAAICIALGLAGFLIWATSGFGTAKRAAPRTGQQVPAGEPVLEDPLSPFRCRRYWGVMIMLSAIMLAAISAFRYVRPESKPIASMPEQAATFPPLKLQGVIVHGAKSSALINGQVLFVGDYIGSVRLVAVNTEHATVELNGQTNVLLLSE